MNGACRVGGIAALGMALLGSAAPVAGKTVGKNPGKVQGRWLRVEDPAALAGYESVCIGKVTADMQWKREGKESPIDEQILKEKIREHLLRNLLKSELYATVSGEVPEEEGACALRLDVDLQVDPGSRAARYVVGLGAGKSKSVLEIHLRDHASDEQLGLYHGYGVGTGMGFKLGGGGARKMTQDDIQENSKKFVQLLKQIL